MATTVPQKYQARTRDWERKSWLYQLYWGQLLSTNEIADRAGVHPSTIKEQLYRHGIPRRTQRYHGDDGNISPFWGFYNGGEVTPDKRGQNYNEWSDL